MLTVVALEAEATELRNVSAVAVALGALARRQRIAVVCERHAFGAPYRLARELRTVLPALRLISVTAGAADNQGAEIASIGMLLDRGALPLVLAPTGATGVVAAELADRLAATAVLRMVEPGLGGTATGARLLGRAARHAGAPSRRR